VAARDSFSSELMRMCTKDAGASGAAGAPPHTYVDVGNEFLWQLVAVCVPCHERFHSSREAADQAHKAA
jgi:hypothetical protein